MNKQDLNYFKNLFKQGFKVTLIYDRMSLKTGAVAVTVNNFKSFKDEIKQLREEHIRYTIRVEHNKYKILDDIKTILAEIKDNADLIGEDTIWHDYVKQINDKLFDLTNVI